MPEPSQLNLNEFTPSADLLTGKVILVTGAGRGIGAAIAEAAAAHGATVILLGRTQENLEVVHDRIQSAGHPDPVLLPFDLSERDPERFHAIARAIEEQFGRLDGLVHAAAVLGQRTPIEQYRHATWEEVFQINVHGAFHLTRALMPLLRRSGHPRILYLTSSVGRTGRAHWGAYAASKFAIEGLAETLADEMKSQGDFCINVVNPGRTRTDMRAAAYPGEDPATVPPADAHDRLFLYLLSEQCSGTNGLSIDAQT